MNVDKLKKILDLMDERGVAEIEIRDWFRKVRITRAGSGPSVSFFSAGGPTGQQLGAAPAAPLPVPAPATAATATASGDPNLIIVKSPMVGTFYRAPAPDAEPFVAVGSAVKKGQVLCIIEAMKILNEIESEYTGAVVKIHVENGAPVEYGQPLFSLSPA